MNKMTPRTFFFLLITILQLCRCTRGDSSSSSSSSSSGSFYQTQMQVCTDSAILVTNITLLCDSPGTYYYGSGKYRNSASCVPGDKAKLSLSFTITQDLTDKYGESPTVLATLQVKGGYFNVYTVYWNTPLCWIGGLTSTASTCPSQGNYSISTTFYWDDDDDDTSSKSQMSSFYPIVTVGFKSSKDVEKYNLGGANTEFCPGKSETYISWSKDLRFSEADAFASFLWSSGILLGVVLVVVLFFFFLQRRQWQRCCFSEEDDGLLDVQEDAKKMALVGTNRMLVDF